MSEAYDKAIFVMDYLRGVGLDMTTVGDAICDENLERSYEIITQNPNITKYEFIEQLGIEYDEEEILVHGFLCHLLMNPYQIMEAMDEDNFEKTLQIMQTQPDISREEFLKVMQLTNKYKGHDLIYTVSDQ